MITCKKCGHVADHDGLACPKCEAIYSKVDSHLAAQEAARVAAKAAAAKREAAELVKREAASAAQQRAALAAFVCQQCGHIGPRVRITRGSFAGELALWIVGLTLTITLLFLVLGIVILLLAFAYTIWRAASRYWACPKCQSPQIIPADTPKGREALKAAGLIT